MIATDEFVLVHVPKTGGSFLRQIVRDSAGGVDVGAPDEHLSLKHLPIEHRGKPSIGFIRNPWDWYVSWYEHQRRHGGNGEWPYERLEVAKGDFSNTVRLAFSIPQYHGVDFYSVIALDYLEDVDDVGRTENLREDFCSFLDRYEIRAPGLREAVQERDPINVGQRRPVESYYDEETAALVAGSQVARRFDYSLRDFFAPSGVTATRES